MLVCAMARITDFLLVEKNSFWTNPNRNARKSGIRENERLDSSADNCSFGWLDDFVLSITLMSATSALNFHYCLIRISFPCISLQCISHCLSSESHTRRRSLFAHFTHSSHSTYYYTLSLSHTLSLAFPAIRMDRVPEHIKQVQDNENETGHTSK